MSSKPNGVSNPTGSSLESDIALLQRILQQTESEGDDADVTELLRRLDSADGIARDVESRLDGMIGGLDDLLGALEPDTDATITQESIGMAVVNGEEVASQEETAAVGKESTGIENQKAREDS
ncbi:hypothetical protein CERSUDRAFT_100696 [Gelatoporia subvermispora B]|uniref:Uncharacterized protein n=1 Tax=Ceriporiopsis subvermispora (strain B) TaxID=914234 RepID=M2QGH8_CERS8|nr:hypothetical protein CERSUDRAFT_100696 [Gelatoporia subvermispora B]